MSSQSSSQYQQQQQQLFDTHFKLAIAAEEENNTEEAFINFRKCYELDRSNREAKQKYLSYFNKNFENENNKKSQDELKLIGNEFMQNNKFEEALIAYTAAIDLDPSVEAAAAIYSNRSLCFCNLEKYQEAYDDGCMASLLRPEWPRGWMRRATAGMKMENYEDAHECYEKYFELDPEGAKSDAEVAKNRNLMRKKVEQLAANKRKKEQRLDKLKKELLSTKDDIERATRAGLLFLRHASSSNFDADVLRLVIEHGLDLNALLPTSRSTYKEYVEKVGPTEASVKNVPLLHLLEKRSSVVDTNTIACFDSVIRFLIDEMVKRNASFPASALALACFCIQPNPDIILALLHTRKVDVNAFDADGYTPLTRVMQASNQLTPDGQVHPATMASLHALLNWEGIDVNLRCNATGGWKIAPLMLANHPDVAKILLRHGANVLAEGTGPSLTSSCKVNALTAAVQATGTPHQAELLRVLIAAGARLIADGADQKSSSTMLDLFKQKEGHWSSHDAIQILLQLNKVQGLEMTFRHTGGKREKESFLSVAVSGGAPLRIIEQLCRWDTSAVNEYWLQRGDETLAVTLLEIAIFSILQNPAKYEQTLNVMKVLLDNGADLVQESRFLVRADLPKNVFHSCCHELGKANLPLEPFYDLIKAKFGEEFLETCLPCENIPQKKK